MMHLLQRCPRHVAAECVKVRASGEFLFTPTKKLDTTMAERSHRRAALAGQRAEATEDPIYALYDELIRARERLAGLPPLKAADLGSVTHALN